MGSAVGQEGSNIDQLSADRDCRFGRGSRALAPPILRLFSWDSYGAGLLKNSSVSRLTKFLGLVEPAK